MRRTHKQSLFVYLLCVAVLFTMGMDFGAKNNVDADANSKIHINPTQLIDLQKLLNPLNTIPFIQPNYKSLTLLFRSIERQQEIDQDQQQLEDQEHQQVEALPEQTKTFIADYEVTAFYLNVRAEKSAISRILNVIKNGDIIEVQNTTTNNWLELKDEGFVHGKYAKLIRVKEIIGENTTNSEVKSHDVEGHVKSQGNETGSNNVLLNKPTTPNEPTTIVKSESNLTEDHIAHLFKGTFLANHGLEQTILEIEEEYGINAYFTIAVMKLESGHGKSKIAKEKNNLFGLNAIDGDAYNKAFSFKTKGESVEKFGQLISKNYVDKGLTSIEKVANKYCKANKKWPSLVMKIMKSDYKKLV